jgi:hypothetical protein
MKKDSMIYKYFESQKKNRTSKEWITTVMSDLKEIDLDKTLRRSKK